MDYSGRQQRLALELRRLKLDAMLITHMPNVRYLTGFTGSSAALLAGSRPLFVTDGRYAEQAREQVAHPRVVVAKGGALVGATREIAARKPSRLGIEAEHMTVATRSLLAREVRGSKLIATSGVVERLRMLKEPEEVDAIREAVLLGGHLLPLVLRALRPGRSEVEVAARLEYAARRAGAEGMSFETIVASGARSALPHGVASEALLPKLGFVVLDYGVILHGYCSDMSRTVHLGKTHPAGKRVVQCGARGAAGGNFGCQPGRENLGGRSGRALGAEALEAGEVLHPLDRTRSWVGDPRTAPRGCHPGRRAEAGHGDHHRTRNLCAGQGRYSN